jgi:hypothetical protein
LRSYDEPPLEGRSPLLYYLVTGRESRQFFAPDYDARVENGEVDAMCAKLGYHTSQKNAQRISRVRLDI